MCSTHVQWGLYMLICMWSWWPWILKICHIYVMVNETVTFRPVYTSNSCQFFFINLFYLFIFLFLEWGVHLIPKRVLGKEVKSGLKSKVKISIQILPPPSTLFPPWGFCTSASACLYLCQFMKISASAKTIFVNIYLVNEILLQFTDSICISSLP